MAYTRTAFPIIHRFHSRTLNAISSLQSTTLGGVVRPHSVCDVYEVVVNGLRNESYTFDEKLMYES